MEQMRDNLENMQQQQTLAQIPGQGRAAALSVALAVAVVAAAASGRWRRRWAWWRRFWRRWRRRRPRRLQLPQVQSEQAAWRALLARRQQPVRRQGFCAARPGRAAAAIQLESFRRDLCGVALHPARARERHEGFFVSVAHWQSFVVAVRQLRDGAGCTGAHGRLFRSSRRSMIRRRGSRLPAI